MASKRPSKAAPWQNLPDELARALERSGGGSPVIALRRGTPEAVDPALKSIADAKTESRERVQFIQALGEIREKRAVPVLLKLLGDSRDDAVRSAALAALAAFDDPTIAPEIIRAWPELTDDVRLVAVSVLASRRGWALDLLSAVNAGRIDRALISSDVAPPHDCLPRRPHRPAHFPSLRLDRRGDDRPDAA